MLEAGIQQLVVADATVNSLIGTRFYPVLVPENPTYPCATFQLISDVAGYSMSYEKGMEMKRIQVDSWSGGVEGASYLAAKNTDIAIRNVLELYRGTLPDGTIVGGIFVANSLDTYEQDARCYRTTTDYLVNYYPQ